MRLKSLLVKGWSEHRISRRMWYLRISLLLSMLVGLPWWWRHHFKLRLWRSYIFMTFTLKRRQLGDHRLFKISSSWFSECGRQKISSNFQLQLLPSKWNFTETWNMSMQSFNSHAVCQLSSYWSTYLSSRRSETGEFRSLTSFLCGALVKISFLISPPQKKLWSINICPNFCVTISA